MQATSWPKRLSGPRAASVLLAAAVVALALGIPGVGRAAEPRAGGDGQPGIRTLILIRHGVYDEEDGSDPEVGKALIPEGREQARLTGRRLAALPVTLDALYASTMTRARQTAEIIGEELGGRVPTLVRDIRECTPPTVREDIMERQGPGEPDSCRRALDRAWDRFFLTAPGDSTLVLVCHGNVIRYLTARALGLDPTLWLNMAIANCSLTLIQVRPDGRTRLLSFSDTGHLPPAMQVYPKPSPDRGAQRPPGAPSQAK